MNGIRIVALSGCLGLLSMIGWQLQAMWSLTMIPPPSQESVRMAIQTTFVVDSQATAQDWVTTALARPLLRETRQPDSVDTLEGEGHPPRLAGIVTGPFGNRAIFVPEHGRTVSLAEGDRIGHLTVRSIASNAIIVETDDRSDAIRPRFKPR